MSTSKRFMMFVPALSIFVALALPAVAQEPANKPAHKSDQSGSTKKAGQNGSAQKSDHKGSTAQKNPGNKSQGQASGTDKKQSLPPSQGERRDQDAGQDRIDAIDTGLSILHSLTGH